jgi:hypothetical protein
MFKITTLSAKSASFNESPSNVCSFVSRRSGGKLTKAAGGTGAGLVGGAFVPAFAGALLVVDTSVELQLDRPNILIKPTPTSVSITRPGVQNDFQPDCLEGEGFDKAI